MPGKSSKKDNAPIYCYKKSQSGQARAKKPCEIKPPFSCAEGYWIIRENFTGEKSFGYFECNRKRCKKKQWKSAHAFKDMKQGCKLCNKESLPVYMWMNKRDFDREQAPTRPKVPHDSKRCEACRKGVCKRS